MRQNRAGSPLQFSWNLSFREVERPFRNADSSRNRQSYPLDSRCLDVHSASGAPAGHATEKSPATSLRRFITLNSQRKVFLGAVFTQQIRPNGAIYSAATPCSSVIPPGNITRTKSCWTSRCFHGGGWNGTAKVPSRAGRRRVRGLDP